MDIASLAAPPEWTRIAPARSMTDSPEHSADSRPRAPTSRGHRLRLLVAGLAIAGIAAALVSWRSAPARRSRRMPVADLSSPYLNTRPGVKYVGDAACVRCHAGIGESYRSHPMGRSLSPIVAADAGASGAPLFVADGLEYSVENREGRVIHVESRRADSGAIVARNEAEVRFVLGSGRQALAYLIDRDGYLFLSPITRYVKAGRWDLSPGYEKTNLHLDRPVVGLCLYCHANRVEPVEGTVNRYEPPIFRGHAIGCERCHGPGELHVRRPEMDGDRDPTIVNPAGLEPGLRDAVCEQCHLSSTDRIARPDRRDDDFRPGLPFHRFWTVLSDAGTAEDRFVGQVEQMHESRCYRESRGRLGCISCHDPHRMPAAGEAVAYYRGRCLECHADRGCSIPLSDRGRADDCAGCHLPRLRSTDVFHGVTTDHRVPRRPAPAEPPPAPDHREARGEGRVVLFHRDRMTEAERAAAHREIGIAMARAYEWPEGADAALPPLDAALAVRPDDVTAWECKGIAMGRLGRHAESLAAFNAALAIEPGRESALADAAEFAAGAGRPGEAVAYWRRAIAVNPWRSVYHAHLANALFDARDWGGAAREAREAIRLSPAELPPRRLLIRCALRLKDNAAALAEIDALLGFDPPDAPELIRRRAALIRP
jgi:Tfp pilus assembly protein PilF